MLGGAQGKWKNGTLVRDQNDPSWTKRDSAFAAEAFDKVGAPLLPMSGLAPCMCQPCIYIYCAQPCMFSTHTHSEYHLQAEKFAKIAMDIKNMLHRQEPNDKQCRECDLTNCVNPQIVGQYQFERLMMFDPPEDEPKPPEGYANALVAETDPTLWKLPVPAAKKPLDSLDAPSLDWARSATDSIV